MEMDTFTVTFLFRFVLFAHIILWLIKLQSVIPLGNFTLCCVEIIKMFHFWLRGHKVWTKFYFIFLCWFGIDNNNVMRPLNKLPHL